MNRRLITILLTAFVIAGVCTYFVAKVVSGMATASKKPNTTTVVAASSDLKLGTLIAKGDLTTIEIAGSVPKGAILKREDAVGRGVVANIYQGEPILDNRLAPVGSGGGLAATIPPGMRACAVKVDDVVGVSGFATPGMRVDVLISGNPPGEQNSATTGPKVKTILQNIQVLSAGTDIQKDDQGKPKQVQVVNLMVTPDQAEILSLATSQEKIQLVLRNPLDTQISQTPGTVVRNLFEDKNPAPVKARSAPVAVHKAAPTYTIEVINGSVRSDQKFATPEGKQ
jgi:pilus assembly protein CpaB